MAKKKLSDFTYLDDNESQNYLASHWPNGKLTAKRFVSSSIIYKFIKSLAVFIKIFTGQIFEIAKNINIRKADSLIEEWEDSVKIPEVISRRNTIEGRREAVEKLISKRPVYNIQNKEGIDINTTYEEFVRCTTGIEIEIEMAYENGFTLEFPFTFPATFGLTEEYLASIFVIKVPIEGSTQNNIFTMTFPVSFFEPEIPQETKDILDKALSRVIPAYAVWIYQVVPS